jgi:hypothetical protein
MNSNEMILTKNPNSIPVNSIPVNSNEFDDSLNDNAIIQSLNKYIQMNTNVYNDYVYFIPDFSDINMLNDDIIEIKYIHLLYTSITDLIDDHFNKSYDFNYYICKISGAHVARIQLFNKNVMFLHMNCKYKKISECRNTVHTSKVQMIEVIEMK